MARVTVPKLKVPLEVVGGRFSVVEQDSDEEVLQCVDAIMRTDVGSRVDEPEFGRPDLAFQRGWNLTDMLRDSVETWEPRASTAMTDDVIDEAIRRVNIQVTGREEG